MSHVAPLAYSRVQYTTKSEMVAFSRRHKDKPLEGMQVGLDCTWVSPGCIMDPWGPDAI